MADKKISQLTALSAANVAPATDVLAIVDTSATETKKITAKDLIDGALNGGTANGVLYLNGSKVATSGSGFTYDGTSALISGGNLRVDRATNTSTLTLGGSPSANWEGDLIFATSNNQINWRIASNRVASGALTFTPSTATGGSTFTTPAVTIDSASNVGIGTTSPAQKLEVAGGMKGGVIHRKGTYSAGATTPSVSGASYLDIANASATSITNFTNAVEGQILILLFRDANTTITRNNAYLSGSVNFTSAANATLTLVYDGTSWYEVSRSITNG